MNQNDNAIRVTMLENPMRGQIHFNITIDKDFFIENPNFLEAMRAYELSDTAAWLGALSNYIRIKREGKKNG